ncbi:hypothetical protein SAFG77S_06355 [Streptomyces afghaniensis]
MISQPVATLIGAAVGAVFGFAASELNRRQKVDELFFAALNFLGGGSQRRNLGISAIELYWKGKRHQKLCTSLLTGSAIYLLRQSSQRTAAHEAFNLHRIMELLLQRPPSHDSRLSYKSLLKSVQEKRAGKQGGVEVADAELAKWEDKLKETLRVEKSRSR